MFIRAIKKIYSKCGHPRFPWRFPVSIWERSSRLDSRVEMSAEDAKYGIPAGWTKLAEWSCDDGHLVSLTSEFRRCRGRGPAFAESMRRKRDADPQDVPKLGGVPGDVMGVKLPTLTSPASPRTSD